MSVTIRKLAAMGKYDRRRIGAGTIRFVRYFSDGKKFTLEVPQMGDSITEGDVAELIKGVGDAVELDEVVAIIETDKVNVDIRSPVAGVVTSMSAAEGDTVEIGSPLMELDLSEGAAPPPAQSKPVTSSTSEEKESPTPTPKIVSESKGGPSVPQSQTTQHRVPLIKFRHGKRDPEETPPPVMPDKGVGDETSADAIPFVELPKIYQRKALSEEAIELINSGGAGPY
mmetsp:Transcript_31555/g.43930  ORF Transcript_31555/g.43930 Transcript_31555/m.43930 type:complete len:227 (+) Transcript_31555:67-747(+)